MPAKPKASARPAAPSPAPAPPGWPWQTPAWTTDERLRRIDALGQRINGYILFLARVGELHGTSAEAKEKAVTAFYEQLTALERKLGRIHDDLQLE